MRQGGWGRRHEPTHPHTITYVHVESQGWPARRLLQNSGFPNLLFLRTVSANLSRYEVDICEGRIQDVQGLCGIVNDGIFYPSAIRPFHDLTPTSAQVDTPQPYGIQLMFANVEGDVVLLNMLALNGRIPTAFRQLLESPEVTIVTWGTNVDLDAIQRGTEYRGAIVGQLDLQSLVSRHRLHDQLDIFQQRTPQLGPEASGPLRIARSQDGRQGCTLESGDMLLPDITTAIYLFFRIDLGEELYTHRPNGYTHVRPFDEFPDFPGFRLIHARVLVAQADILMAMLARTFVRPAIMVQTIEPTNLMRVLQGLNVEYTLRPEFDFGQAPYNFCFTLPDIPGQPPPPPPSYVTNRQTLLSTYWSLSVVDVPLHAQYPCSLNYVAEQFRVNLPTARDEYQRWQLTFDVIPEGPAQAMVPRKEVVNERRTENVNFQTKGQPTFTGQQRRAVLARDEEEVRVARTYLYQLELKAGATSTHNVGPVRFNDANDMLLVQYHLRIRELQAHLMRTKQGYKRPEPIGQVMPRMSGFRPVSSVIRAAPSASEILQQPSSATPQTFRLPIPLGTSIGPAPLILPGPHLSRPQIRPSIPSPGPRARSTPQSSGLFPPGTRFPLLIPAAEGPLLRPRSHSTSAWPEGGPSPFKVPAVPLPRLGPLIGSQPVLAQAAGMQAKTIHLQAELPQLLQAGSLKPLPTARELFQPIVPAEIASPSIVPLPTVEPAFTSGAPAAVTPIMQPESEPYRRVREALAQIPQSRPLEDRLPVPAIRPSRPPMEGAAHWFRWWERMSDAIAVAQRATTMAYNDNLLDSVTHRNLIVELAPDDWPPIESGRIPPDPDFFSTSHYTSFIQSLTQPQLPPMTMLLRTLLLRQDLMRWQQLTAELTQAQRTIVEQFAPQGDRPERLRISPEHQAAMREVVSNIETDSALGHYFASAELMKAYREHNLYAQQFQPAEQVARAVVFRRYLPLLEDSTYDDDLSLRIPDPALVMRLSSFAPTGAEYEQLVPLDRSALRITRVAAQDVLHQFLRSETIEPELRSPNFYLNSIRLIQILAVAFLSLLAEAERRNWTTQILNYMCLELCHQLQGSLQRAFGFNSSSETQRARCMAAYHVLNFDDSLAMYLRPAFSRHMTEIYEIRRYAYAVRYQWSQNPVLDPTKEVVIQQLRQPWIIPSFPRYPPIGADVVIHMDEQLPAREFSFDVDSALRHINAVGPIRRALELLAQSEATQSPGPEVIPIDSSSSSDDDMPPPPPPAGAPIVTSSSLVADVISHEEEVFTSPLERRITAPGAIARIPLRGTTQVTQFNLERARQQKDQERRGSRNGSQAEIKDFATGARSEQSLARPRRSQLETMTTITPTVIPVAQRFQPQLIGDLGRSRSPTPSFYTVASRAQRIGGPALTTRLSPPPRDPRRDALPSNEGTRIYFLETAPESEIIEVSDVTVSPQPVVERKITMILSPTSSVTSSQRGPKPSQSTRRRQRRQREKDRHRVDLAAKLAAEYATRSSVETDASSRPETPIDQELTPTPSRRGSPIRTPPPDKNHRYAQLPRTPQAGGTGTRPQRRTSSSSSATSELATIFDSPRRSLRLAEKRAEQARTAPFSSDTRQPRMMPPTQMRPLNINIPRLPAPSTFVTPGPVVLSSQGRGQRGPFPRMGSVPQSISNQGLLAPTMPAHTPEFTTQGILPRLPSSAFLRSISLRPLHLLGAEEAQQKAKPRRYEEPVAEVSSTSTQIRSRPRERRQSGSKPRRLPSAVVVRRKQQERRDQERLKEYLLPDDIAQRDRSLGLSPRKGPFQGARTREQYEFETRLRCEGHILGLPTHIMNSPEPSTSGIIIKAESPSPPGSELSPAGIPTDQPPRVPSLVVVAPLVDSTTSSAITTLTTTATATPLVQADPLTDTIVKMEAVEVTEPMAQSPPAVPSTPTAPMETDAIDVKVEEVDDLFQVPTSPETAPMPSPEQVEPTTETSADPENEAEEEL